ncbi:MAG: TipAS antibiotic-recognition domain-containing protein [Anaerolineae bacterium]|nr:TipAS antibiotic-recognition domain-containing protein [Anaerolineae bacterium]
MNRYTVGQLTAIAGVSVRTLHYYDEIGLLHPSSRSEAGCRRTIDRTMRSLREKTMLLTDEELYEGLAQEQAERYQRETRESYDPALVAESERRLRKMSKEQWQALKSEIGEVTVQLAEAMEKGPESPEVQELVAWHFRVMEKSYPVSPDIYQGLAQLYIDHAEFRAFYERIRPGLAKFLNAAMTYYAAGLETS